MDADGFLVEGDEEIDEDYIPPPLPPRLRPLSPISPTSSSAPSPSSSPQSVERDELLSVGSVFIPKHPRRRPASLLRLRRLQQVRAQVFQALVRRRLCSLFAQSLRLSTYKEFSFAHHTAVLCLCVESVESRYLLSSSLSGRICLFDTQAPKYPSNPNETNLLQLEPLHALDATLTNHTHGVSAVEWFSRDTGLFFSGGYNRRVRIWDTNRLKVVMTHRYPAKVYDISFPPSFPHQHNLLAIACGEPQISLCDFAGGAGTARRLGTSAHRGSVLRVVWSPFREFELLSCASDGSVVLWDIRRSGWLRCFDENGSTNVSCSLRASERNLTVPKAHSGGCNGAIYLSEENRILTTGLDSRLRLWDVDTGECLRDSFTSILNSREGKTHRICITSDGRYVLHPNDKEIDLYDVASGKYVRTLKSPHYANVNCVVCRSGAGCGGEEIYSGGDDHAMFVYCSDLIDETMRKKYIQE